MVYVIAFLILFAYTAILWVVVLALYSAFFEPFDFGPLGSFAVKSMILISIICLSALFFGIAGRLVNLLIWWIGLVVLFRKDMWESRVLVILLWGVHFLAGLAVGIIIQSLFRPAA
jgi:hypothetical protein